VYLRALEFARLLGQAKAFDVQYVAVADVQRATLVTADSGMHHAALRLGISAKLLA